MNKKEPRHKTRIFSEKNILKFMTLLDDVQWDNELSMYDGVNDMCDFMMYKIDNFFQNSFPLVTVSRKRNKDKPWMNQNLRREIETKNKLYRKSITEPNDSNITDYKRSKLRVEKRDKIFSDKILSKHF